MKSGTKLICLRLLNELLELVKKNFLKLCVCLKHVNFSNIEVKKVGF